MPIHNMKAYAESVWQWSTVLNGCFGKTNIEPSDIDGIVERNGHFLVLETKGPRAKMSRGQERMLRRLSRLDNFTVVVVWGKRHQPERILIMNKKGDLYYKSAGREKIRHIVIEWWLHANRSRSDGGRRF